ncbi:MAG: YjbH domain-containing protein, partial [Paracoccus sp. (in: a-proteobacteria)]
MRHSRLYRQFLATTLPVALLLGSGSQTALAEPMIGQSLNAYAMPGAIDTPTAEGLPDATLAGSIGYSNYSRRNAITFQALPRMTVVLRYSRLDGFDRGRDYLWDRSFDLRFRFLDEDEDGWRPAVAVGLRDFMGTGVYSAEYFVATKTLTPTLRASVGVGWGRLGGKARWTRDVGEGGKPNVDDWFTGPAKPFASVSWQATDKLRLVAEYSNDHYENEVREGGEKEPKSKLNLGLNYHFGENYQVGLYTIGGNTFGAQFSVALNPRQAPFPSGLEKAPAPVRPRPAPGADPEGWGGVWANDPTAHPAIQTALGDALGKEGQLLESMALSPTRAEVRIRNNRYIQHAEAIGRTARLMTRALPPSVETFVITTSADGLPTSSVTLRRSDIERLENTEAGQIANVAVLTDAEPRPAGLVRTPGLYPQFQWVLKPYLSTSLFDPDQPLRYEVGAEAKAKYEIVPGLVLAGTLRQRAFGSIKQDAPGNMSVDEYDGLNSDYVDYIDDDTGEVFYKGVPRVRSDSRMYSGNKKPSIPELTLNWYAKPTDTVYTRVTVGLLERAYGGVSAEALWKPVNSRLALGAEINRVRKRDFEDAFSFRDYEVTTGHVSA